MSYKNNALSISGHRPYTLLVLFIILITTSCDNKPDSTTSAPTQAVTAQKSAYQQKANHQGNLITARLLETRQFDQVLAPYKIEIADQSLVLIESRSVPTDKPIIHILDAQSLEYKMAKGKNGLGPNEITDAHLFQFQPEIENSFFWVNSTMSKRMAKFSLSNDSLMAVEEFRQPQKMFAAIKTLRTSKGTFLSEMASDTHKFVEFNSLGERIQGIGKWDEVPGYPNLSNFQQRGVNTGWFKADPYSDIFVKASLFRDRLEILDYQNKTVKSVDYPTNDIAPFQLAGSGPHADAIYPPETKYTYRDITFSNDYIYALYGGHSYLDYMQDTRIAETIHVFNKTDNYEYLHTIKLPVSVSTIAVDPNNERIYAILANEEEGQLVVFNISQDSSPTLSSEPASELSASVFGPPSSKNKKDE